MEYKAISKKTMRSKDFKALKAKKPGYRMHVATTEDNTKEVLFRTPRGFFLQDSSEPAIEISVTQAQAFYDTYGIRVETGLVDMTREELKERVSKLIQTLENVERSLQFTNIPVHVLTNYIKEETNIDITKN